jgi:hypothetical protein
MDIPVLHGLCDTLHATFRQAGPLGQLTHALGIMVTKTLENPQTFGPKSHVSRCAEG